MNQLLIHEGEYGGLSSRRRRHSIRVLPETGLRDRSAVPAFAANSDRIQLNPPGSSMPQRERILK